MMVVLVRDTAMCLMKKSIKMTSLPGLDILISIHLQVQLHQHLTI